MIKLIAVLIGLFLFSRPVFPADETNKTPAAPALPEATPGQAGTNEAAAVSGARRRDPFWPIGFFPASMPGGTHAPADSVDSVRDKKTAFQAAGLSGMLRIGGIVRKGNKFYATVNGFTVQTGEVISVVADGGVYKFVIEGIDFNKVQFRPIKR